MSPVPTLCKIKSNLWFYIYFIYSASSIKGKRDYNNSEINQSFLKSYVHAYMQGREITH